MTDVEVLAPRDVPLGGPRAMRVRRTLPQRHRSLIGAWCFVDHYGPDAVDETGGMVLPAHPHTGLQTASWLFGGELEHRDSVGSLATVRPGELNLMTAGRGISHTEVSTPQTTTLHGAQLMLARGKSLEVAVDPTFEHGVLLDVGALDVDGQELAPGDLGHVPHGRPAITVSAQEEARILLLGRPPFGEPIVMWWNFIGRSHDEIAAYREEWQQQITAEGGVVEDGRAVADGRFGKVGLDLPPIPAPEMPNVRL